MEMLLPNSKMKNYTRLVLGLFVMVLVLDPVLALLNKDDRFAAQAWSTPTQKEELGEILKNAEELSGQSRETVNTQYAAKLEQQITALVMLAPEIENAEVSVKLEDTHGQFDSGAINEVTVTASIDKNQENDKEVAEVERVDINDSMEKTGRQKQPSASTPQQIERRIRSIVGDFYGLGADQIVVKLEN
jgi:stage III sporulation protein AF